MRLKLRWLGFVLATALATASWAGEPRNLSVLKQEIVTYVESGGYESDIKAAIAPALEFIATRSAAKRSGERLALVLDVDETALSNLPHMRALDFGYVPAEWDAWVARGEAPAIVPVSEVTLMQSSARSPVLTGWEPGRMQRVSTGFYTSQAFELRRPA
jgi:hypothetical protein